MDMAKAGRLGEWGRFEMLNRGASYAMMPNGCLDPVIISVILA